MEIITAYRAWNRVQKLLSAPTPSSAFHCRHLSGYNITQPHYHTGEMCGSNTPQVHVSMWHKIYEAIFSPNDSYKDMQVKAGCQLANSSFHSSAYNHTHPQLPSVLQSLTHKRVYQGNGWTHRLGFRSCLLHYPYEQGHVLSFFVPQIPYLMGL